jgi:alkanesulfonate monooxygenase SsuD/methylene tetrahydromethanopterin reductase-like flavin-dependent oxidoreductase (luciferase family)
MKIKIGLFLSNQFPAEDDIRLRLEEIFEQVRHARRNHFYSLWVGQHFLTKPLQMFQSTPLLARLIPEAEGMMIGPNILILPLLNPVTVAEESATMDQLTGGRYILGVGLGYRDEEFQVFNVNKSERVGRMNEAINLIRRLWTEETVEHDGTFYKVPKMGLGIKPLRPGGPPIWIGASVDSAIKRAAKIGDAWLITFYPSISWLSEQMKIYRTALEEVGKPEPEDVPILRECYVSPHHNSAFEEASPSMKVKYDAYAAWGQDQFLPKEEKFNQPFDQFVNDRFIIGDPSFVREEIQRYYEVLGVNHFILRLQWPGLAQEKVLQSIKLMGEKVIPYLG